MKKIGDTTRVTLAEAKRTRGRTNFARLKSEQKKEKANSSVEKMPETR
jgi:hypothetical protein